MKKLTVVFVLIFGFNFILAQEPNNTHNLQITVTNFENTKGSLIVCLTDKKEDFLKQCEYATAVTVTNNTISSINNKLNDKTKLKIELYLNNHNEPPQTIHLFCLNIMYLKHYL